MSTWALGNLSCKKNNYIIKNHLICRFTRLQWYKNRANIAKSIMNILVFIRNVEDFVCKTVVLHLASTSPPPSKIPTYPSPLKKSPKYLFLKSSYWKYLPLLLPLRCYMYILRKDKMSRTQSGDWIQGFKFVSLFVSFSNSFGNFFVVFF